MNPLIQLYEVLLFQPILNGLVLLYNIFPGADFGIALIILTVLVKLLFHPLSMKAVRSQKVMMDLQKDVQELRKKHKDNPQKQTEELLNLYKKHGVSPFGTMTPILLQLPILIPLYQVIIRGFTPETMNYVYPFIAAPEQLNPMFLGVIDLSQPSLILVVIVAAFQFLQMKMFQPQAAAGPQSGIQKNMPYIFTGISILILRTLPSGIALYWFVNIVFTIIQQKRILGSKEGNTEQA